MKYEVFLRRIINSRKLSLALKRKLSKLYNGELFLMRDRDTVTNLSCRGSDRTCFKPGNQLPFKRNIVHNAKTYASYV